MLSDNVEKSLSSEEKIPVGSIVSNKAHPYQETNTNILITNYAHFTPPLMVVVEKNYGAKYSSADGKEEDNDSYKCLYYSTISGCFETNWFKRKEIKFIENKASELLEELNNSNLEELKRSCLGRTVILSSVDLELGKKKIWSDDEGEKVKMKTNNLLDYLPPLGTVIDVKYNDDYQKFNEKNGKPIHRKSKVLLKLRWLNNITAKYSEEYVPLVALKLVDNKLTEFAPDLYYADLSGFSLEENIAVKIVKTPLQIKDILWKHYYYIYRFVDQFTKQIVTYQANDLNKIEKADSIDKLLFDYKFDYKRVFEFFDLENKSKFEKKWFQIHYSDKNERYSQRIIYINEIIVEKTSSEPIKERILLKANCLLRNGKIRHFNIGRIQGFTEMSEGFVNEFIK